MSSTVRPELARTSLSSRISGALPTTGWNGNSGERARRRPTASYPAAAAASTYSIGGVSGNVGGESASRFRITGTRSYTLSRTHPGVPFGAPIQGGPHDLRAAAVHHPSRPAREVGEVHGRGDHPVPGQDGHGHPRQLRRRGRRERLRLAPPVRERTGAEAPLRCGLPERLLEDRDRPEGRSLDRSRADQGHPPDGDAALGHPVAWASRPTRSTIASRS